MKLPLSLRLLPLLPLVSTVAADGLPPTRLSERQDVQAFIAQMVQKHDWDRQNLVDLFDAANLRPGIVAALDKPSTSRAWYQFHPNFLTAQKTRGGVAFWHRHREWLTKAREKYGVPEEVIIAIIGVETDYGKHLGHYRAFDALTTIAFEYPRRAEYFRQELEQFLLLAREENVDPLTLQSSYAGALGWPQFMPGSFRSYAVDFDEDGIRDIWKNPVDVIGSIAYYFSKFGWQRDDAIVQEASADDGVLDTLAAEKFNLKYTVGELQQMGIKPLQPLDAQQKALAFNLETAPGHFQAWLGLNNFYVITRYNKSINYAIAVTRLSQSIGAAYRASEAGQQPDGTKTKRR